MTQEPSGAGAGDQHPGPDHAAAPHGYGPGGAGDTPPGPTYGGYQEGVYGEPVPDRSQPGSSPYPPQGHPPQGYPPAGYPPQGYPPQGYPPQGYPPAGYPPPGYPPVGWGPPRPTNGMAVASLVLGILWIYWIGSVLALVFGYQARRQIAERGESGSGLATAGIVLGWIGVGALVLFGGFLLVGLLWAPSGRYG